MTKTKIDKKDNVINITLPTKKIKGSAGKDGIVGKDGSAGKDGIDGRDGAVGKAGSSGIAGKDYNPQIEQDILNNKKGITTAEKIIGNNTDNIGTLDGNITEHIDDDDIHFDDGTQKEKVIDHLNQPHQTFIGGGGAPGTDGVDGADGSGITIVGLNADNRMVKTVFNNPSIGDLEQTGVSIDDNNNIVLLAGTKIIFDG